jgi:hypothetical protein
MASEKKSIAHLGNSALFSFMITHLPLQLTVIQPKAGHFIG